MSEIVEPAGKTVVVTGASSGIGRAIAQRLGRAGAHVYLAGRSEEPLAESAARIESEGGKATTQTFDVRDVEALRDFVARAESDTGRLDIMVNNAGLGHLGPVLDGDPEQWRTMLETNVLALLVGCQAGVEAMRRCGAEGHIVNISSVAARNPESGVYGATKHAVNVISNTLRAELGDDTIRVVTVMPGVIATNFVRHFDPDALTAIAAAAGVEVEVAPGAKVPDEVLTATQKLMEQQVGMPEDVAEVVYFAVTQPIRVNISEIVVRPPKSIEL